MITTVIEVITPERASEYMRHNKANRTLRSGRVADLMRDMKSGKWRITHQGIAFDVDGNLIDGQHRLTAVILSGVTVEMMVTRGIERDAIMNIDTVLTRNICDVYKIRACFTGDEGDPALRHKKVIAACRLLVRCGYKPGMTMSNDETDTVLTSLAPYCRKMYKAMVTRGRAAPAAVCAAVLAALICGEDEEDVYKFASVFLNGDTRDCDGLNTGAAFRLATALMDAKVKRTPYTKERMYKIAQNAVWQFLHGTDTKALREPKQLRYPVSIVIKSILGGDEEHAESH